MEENYYDKKQRKTLSSMKLSFNLFAWVIIGTIILVLNAPVLIALYLLSCIIVIIYIIKYNYEKNKTHEIFPRIDTFGAIQVFDFEGLIAIVYKDKTIDWARSTSIYKMTKIKYISENFEKTYKKLEDELC